MGDKTAKTENQNKSICPWLCVAVERALNRSVQPTTCFYEEGGFRGHNPTHSCYHSSVWPEKPGHSYLTLFRKCLPNPHMYVALARVWGYRDGEDRWETGEVNRRPAYMIQINLCRHLCWCVCTYARTEGELLEWWPPACKHVGSQPHDGILVFFTLHRNTVCIILSSSKHMLFQKPGNLLEHWKVKNNRSSDTFWLFPRTWDSDRFENSVERQDLLHDPNFWNLCGFFFNIPFLLNTQDMDVASCDNLKPYR